ncbi:MAG: BspA family leucine-rich repeat surface protein [Marinicellaceae bacterium]
MSLSFAPNSHKTNRLFSIGLFIILCCFKSITQAAPEDEFVTVWKTDHPGVSSSTSITIPTIGLGYLYDVDWDGDGSFDEFGLTESVTHDYGVAGEYVVRIRGDFPRIYFDNSGDKEKIISIVQWGTGQWLTFLNAFYGAKNLVNNADDVPNLTQVTTMRAMFRNCEQITTGTGNWDWQTDTIENMSSAFTNIGSLNFNIGNWNVESVSNFNNIFVNTTFSSDIYDQLLTGWNQQSLMPSQTIDMGTAQYCSQEAQLARVNMSNNDLWTIIDGGLCDAAYFTTTWKTDNPGGSNSTSITIPTDSGTYNYQVDWNGDGDFNDAEEIIPYTGNATHDYGVAGTYTINIKGTFPQIEMSFSGEEEKILSVEQWGTNRWASMRNAFRGASNLIVNAQDTPNLSQATSLSYMFDGAKNLGTGNGNWQWDTHTIKFMNGMFKNASSFNKDIGSWNTSQVLNMEEMFKGWFSDLMIFNQEIGSWDTSQVTDMNSMFEYSGSFNQDIGNWNTSQVTDMSNMFKDAGVFNQNIGGWETSMVQDMSNMFDSAEVFNQDISGWDTSKVQDMRSMFSSAGSFNQDIGNWNTLLVTDMSSMFRNATLFNHDIGDWSTANVDNMSFMFFDASAFNQDIGHWNTSAVTTMTWMFYDAINFNQDIGNWNTSMVTDMTNMFNGAVLFNQDISGWNIKLVNRIFGFLARTTLSSNHYDLFLISLNTQVSIPDLEFDGGNAKFCSQLAVDARLQMENTLNWVIEDGGIQSECFTGDVDLEVTISDNTAIATPSDLVDYVVEITNLGIDNAVDVEVDLSYALSPFNAIDWICNSTAESNCSPNGSSSFSDTFDIASGQSISYTITTTIRDDLDFDVDIAIEARTSTYQADKEPTNNIAQDINVFFGDSIFSNSFEQIVTLFHSSVSQISYDFSEDNVAHIDIVPYAIGQGFDENYNTNMWLHLRKNNDQLQIRQSRINLQEGIWNIGIWQDVFNEGITTIEWFD